MNKSLFYIYIEYVVKITYFSLNFQYKKKSPMEWWHDFGCKEPRDDHQHTQFLRVFVTHSTQPHFERELFLDFWCIFLFFYVIKTQCNRFDTICNFYSDTICVLNKYWEVEWINELKYATKIKNFGFKCVWMCVYFVRLFYKIT